MVKGADGKPKLAMDHGVPRPRVQPRQLRFLAVDPGDVHVGVAEFVRLPTGVWIVEWAGEKTPDEFLRFLHAGIRRHVWDWLVVEEWRLFPEHAPRAIGSDMPTSRLIGAIEALAKFTPEISWPDDGSDRVPVHLQSPKIKVPTRSWLRKRKLRSVAKMLKVAGDHATDAELHGYHFLVRSESSVWTTMDQNRMHPQLTPSHDLW